MRELDNFKYEEQENKEQEGNVITKTQLMDLIVAASAANDNERYRILLNIFLNLKEGQEYVSLK